MTQQTDMHMAYHAPPDLCCASSLRLLMTCRPILNITALPWHDLALSSPFTLVMYYACVCVRRILYTYRVLARCVCVYIDAVAGLYKRTACATGIAFRSFASPNKGLDRLRMRCAVRTARLPSFLRVTHGHDGVLHGVPETDVQADGACSLTIVAERRPARRR